MMIVRKYTTRTYVAGWLLWGSLLLPAVQHVFRDEGVRWIYILLFSFFLSCLLTPLMRRFAIRFSILDYPCERKVHKKPTPLLGGMAIYLAFTTSILANNIFDSEVIVILIASTAVMLISLADDIKSLSAKSKLVAQLGATGLVFWFGVRITIFPPGGIGEVANILLSFMWVVGVTNAMNFMDGTDGLAVGLGIVISLFLGVVAFQTDQAFLGWFAIAMMGSCLGFLPYNFRPTRSAGIFLGDTGSAFIGFTLACLAMKGEWADSDPIVSICAPIMIFGVLIFDITHTTITRIFSGKVRSFHEWLAYVGKDHIHHRMYRLFQSNKKTVGLILAMSSCLGISAVVLRHVRTIDGILIVCQGIIAFIIFSVIDSQQEKIRMDFESKSSWFRIQQFLDVVVRLPGTHVQFEGAIIDISPSGAKVLTHYPAPSIDIGTSVSLASRELDEADLPRPEGRVVRKTRVTLNGDTAKYIEFGIQFTDFKQDNTIHLVEYLYKKEIEKRNTALLKLARPLPDHEYTADVKPFEVSQ